MSDDVRWFQSLGLCSCGCGKKATGKLMGSRNDSYGAYAESCANKRLVAAKKAREKEQQSYARIPDFEHPYHECGKD